MTSLAVYMSKFHEPVVSECIRLKPRNGIDTTNLIEYDISNILKGYEGLRHLACFNEIIMMQPQSYTCPITVAMAYAHDQPIEYFNYEKDKHKLFKVFESVDEKDMVLEMAEKNQLKISRIHEEKMPEQQSNTQPKHTLKYQAIEFQPDLEDKNDEIIYPVCWMKICSNRINHIRLRLSRYISSRFITVQFIRVDNRSFEVNGYYDSEANVDISSIQFIGHSIPSHIFEH